uniref:Uncharacterized protein n=1 Tax=Triticum urartu TaxID=4572 RepID=A0A8R7VCT8_TRIUA
MGGLPQPQRRAQCVLLTTLVQKAAQICQGGNQMQVLKTSNECWDPFPLFVFEGFVCRIMRCIGGFSYRGSCYHQFIMHIHASSSIS